MDHTAANLMELSTHSENVELNALQALHRLASDADGEALGLIFEQRDGYAISSAKQLPASAIVINRAMLLANKSESLEATAQIIRDHYQSQHVGRYLIQLLSDQYLPEELEKLTALDLKPVRAWQKFKRNNQPLATPNTHLTVRRVGPEYGLDFARIACAGFDLGNIAESWLAKLCNDEQWQIYMSFENQEPVGVGAMFVEGQCAWFDFGATAPEHRCKGSQNAVLAARVNAAIEQGCQHMFTCTGVDVPGDPQHSYNNILKAGFEESYVKENWSPLGC
ncbi:MAG: hypothetical protein MI976_06245 [Pseudomonadales bacterium]|nr:hypothetical protein [Pseudomonadales bacterium]